MSDPGTRAFGPVALQRVPAGRRAAVRPESLEPLVEALAAIAAADSADVADAVVVGARELVNARGAALAVLDGDAATILASAGYDCDSMSAGSRLPLDAGLPLTESVRSGRTISRGAPGEPAWLATPVVGPGLRGALLVSLHPHADPDPVALDTLASAAAAALGRTAIAPARQASYDAVAAGLTVATIAPPGWLDVAATLEPATADRGLPGGDVVVVMPGDSPDVAWVVVGDVCGCGVVAAPAAAQVRQLAIALAHDDAGPGRLLAAIDTALRRDPAAQRFVTAVAVRLQRRGEAVDAAVAGAGHPRPLVWRDGVVTRLDVDAPPLNLDLPDEPWSSPAPVLVTLEPGDLLLLHTDGFVDRGAGDRTDDLAELFARAGALGDAEAVADVLVSAMAATVDAPRDDLAVVVAAPRTD